jgi:hypothetical protein
MLISVLAAGLLKRRQLLNILGFDDMPCAASNAAKTMPTSAPLRGLRAS